MIAFADVPIGHDGELVCVSCHGRLLSTPVPYPVEEVSSSISTVTRNWRTGPGPNIVFGGYEPFRHPSLPDLVEASRSAGVQRIGLRTDGGALAKSLNAQGVLRAGVHHFEIILLAAGDDGDRLAGRKGLSDARAAGLDELFRCAGNDSLPLAVTVTIPVCRHNVSLLSAAVAHAATLGAVCVHLVATNVREKDRAYVIAALDTAAVNGLAACVTAPDDPAFALWTVCPSTRVEVGM